MCKRVDLQKIHDEEHPNQAFPQVLLALIRLERKAFNDFASVEEDCRQVEEMRTVLSKLSVTHIDSDNYATYLFKRAEQLSAHLETYKQIVGKIDFGHEIEDIFSKVSKQFLDYLKERIEFKSVWIESLELIELGKQTVEERLLCLVKLQSIAQEAYEAKNYFELSDIKAKCDQELAVVNEMMETCLSSGKKCKEYGSQLYDQLTELEGSFQGVVKLSMNRINEMKRTPAVAGDASTKW